MEAELKEILTRIENRLDRMDGRMDRVEEEVRHTRVLLEGQRSDIKQLAEGIIGGNERLDAFRREVEAQYQDIRGLVVPYGGLDSRIRVLESWKERTDRDPMEIIRERYGRPKTT